MIQSVRLSGLAFTVLVGALTRDALAQEAFIKKSGKTAIPACGAIVRDDRQLAGLLSAMSDGRGCEMEIRVVRPEKKQEGEK